LKWNSTYLFTIKWGTHYNKAGMGAGRSTFSYLILNCKQFTKLYILLTCQQIGVNTFYKCIEFQVNSFDSYWEIFIEMKLTYLFTIKWGTHYNKAGDPVICISRVICPCFGIVHNAFYKCIEFQVNSFDSYWEILITVY
jgi:hypothetical protein